MEREGERRRKREEGLLAARTEALFPQKQFLLIARKKRAEHPAPLRSHQKKALWLGDSSRSAAARLLPVLWLGGKQPFGKDAEPSRKGVINGMDMPKMSAPRLPGSGSAELSQGPWVRAGKSLGLSLHQLLPPGPTSPVRMW